MTTGIRVAVGWGALLGLAACGESGGTATAGVVSTDTAADASDARSVVPSSEKEAAAAGAAPCGHQAERCCAEGALCGAGLTCSDEFCLACGPRRLRSLDVPMSLRAQSRLPAGFTRPEASWVRRTRSSTTTCVPLGITATTATRTRSSRSNLGAVTTLDGVTLWPKMTPADGRVRLSLRYRARPQVLGARTHAGRVGAHPSQELCPLASGVRAGALGALLPVSTIIETPSFAALREVSLYAHCSGKQTGVSGRERLSPRLELGCPGNNPGEPETMRLLFITMDPVDTMLPDKDTTYAFLRGAERRGPELSRRVSQLSGRGARGRVRRNPTLGFQAVRAARRGPESASVAEFDAFSSARSSIRRAYLYATLLLEQVRGRTLLINDPRGLRDANEKLYALQFRGVRRRDRGELPTASDPRFLPRGRRPGGHQAARRRGRPGVLALSRATRTRAPSSTCSRTRGSAGDGAGVPAGGTERRQAHPPARRRALGAILRVPRGDDLRSNIHVGGSVVPDRAVTPRERRWCRPSRPRLRADGLIFVGLDVIGERLTEVNVTAPRGSSSSVDSPVKSRKKR